MRELVDSTFLDDSVEFVRCELALDCTTSQSNKLCLDVTLQYAGREFEFSESNKVSYQLVRG